MPTKRHKHKVTRRTYVLDAYLTDELKGAHVVMASMTARELIRLRSGELNEGEAITFAASKIVEHDLDIDDPLDLDAPDLLAISQAWSAAMKGAAVPPENGDS